MGARYIRDCILPKFGLCVGLKGKRSAEHRAIRNLKGRRGNKFGCGLNVSRAKRAKKRLSKKNSRLGVKNKNTASRMECELSLGCRVA